MNLPKILNHAGKVLRNNSPAILTAIGVSGTISTAYLTGVASFKAAGRLSEEAPDLSVKEKVEIVWDLYIPAATTGVITIGCIIAANHVNSKRIAAAYSLISVSEKAFEEYRVKVVEKIGENKERAVRDEVAQDRIDNNPPGAVVVGSGSVLCCELFTGRYFNSDMETLRKAQNDINAKLIGELYVPLCDFYYIIGLPYTTYSGQIGWEAGRPMSLDFSTVMSPDNRPCIAFDYNYTKPI